MRKIFLLFFIFFIVLQAVAQNPFEKYGYTPKVGTLTGGKYEEFFDRDSVVQIGQVLYNPYQKKIVGFVDTDTLLSEATRRPELISRWLSPDPHAENYFNISPYVYVANNPIIFIDPDGRDIELGNLYAKDADGNYLYETMIRAFEAFAATKVGREWIGSRAQEGFKLDFAFEKGGISIDKAGDLSTVVDYNFKVGDETKGGIALTEYDTSGDKLVIDITFDRHASESKNSDAFTFLQMGDAVFHETNFHGYHAEKKYLEGERNAYNLRTGNHKQSDLQNSPFGEKGYSYYLYMVNKKSTQNMKGYGRYSKYTKHSNETYKFWWNEFMGQFTN